MSAPREYFGATLLTNGKVLVSGGTPNRRDILGTSEVYDPARGNWARAGDLVIARFVHTSTLLPSGKVLVASGHPPASVGPTSEIYDPQGGP
jgi:hypothetical protein